MGAEPSNRFLLLLEVVVASFPNAPDAALGRLFAWFPPLGEPFLVVAIYREKKR